MKTYRIFVIFLLFFCSKITAQQLLNCSICSSQVVLNQQINELNIEQLHYLINDLLARKGHKFDNPHISMHFSEKDWYRPLSNNDGIILGSIENQNINLFKQRISELKIFREKLINELKVFKLLLLKNQKKELQAEFNYSSETETFLTQILQKIDLDNIHWQGQNARYQLQIDNGESTSTFGVYITDNKEVGFKYTLQEETTELGENLYSTDFYIERTYYWYFEWNGEKLTFVNKIIAN